MIVQQSTNKHHEILLFLHVFVKKNVAIIGRDAKELRGCDS